MADSTTNDELLLRFDAPDGDLALIVEDDARVAYAYLLQNEQVVSDVWLYNIAPAPETAQWSDPREMPFLNPAEYCKPGSITRLAKESNIQCKWYPNAVELLVDGTSWAYLEKGRKPSWSRWTLREGPLARPLDGTFQHE